MSAPRPGRRAAPKPSRFSAFKGPRKSSGGGKRAAGRPPGTETSTEIPVITEPLLEPDEATAGVPPEIDPLDRPLLDTDPFGIRAALAAPSALAEGYEPPEPMGQATAALEHADAGAPTQETYAAPAVATPAALAPTVIQPLPVAEPIEHALAQQHDDAPLLSAAEDPDFHAPEGYVVEPEEPPVTQVRRPGSLERYRAARTRLFFWSCILVSGMMLLGAAALHKGPEWLDGAGAVLVLASYAWAVMARTGGRQVVFSCLAVVIGVTAVATDAAMLRSGAAVLTCVTSGLLAVVLTVPAKNVLIAAREVVVATAVASIGAFATIGFEPVASTMRFEYVTLVVGFVLMFALVWRFAAGLHGLGTRGLVIIVAGSTALVVSLVYSELLQHFAASGFVQYGDDFSEWLRSTIGAVPRPITVFLGVPALVWGVHMRARRRQGWWVCAFGAAATLPVAQRLVNLDTSYVEAGLQTAYSVALGLVVGFVLIRIDLAFTGQRGARARAAEEAHAVRPEPARFSSL